jgi:hypothetical protein
MNYLGKNITFVSQSTNGALALYEVFYAAVGFVLGYSVDMDTRNGGADQNQLWVRAGTRSTKDLNLARDIIARTGTIFNPTAIIVATWYKVEAFDSQLHAGVQNTFQLAMPYSETGTTWVIFAYSQLQFYLSDTLTRAYVEWSLKGTTIQRLSEVNSNEKMIALLNGTNCNRTGVYAFPINTAPTRAPTKAPTMAPATNAPYKAPAKVPFKAPSLASPNAPIPVPVPLPAPTPQSCGLFGGGIFCPRTRCGFLGRWLNFCATV